MVCLVPFYPIEMLFFLPISGRNCFVLSKPTSHEHLVPSTLALPEDSKIHPIFQVSLLRLAHGRSPSTPPALPISAEWEQVLVPEKVLAHHWVSRSSTPVLELLVKWQQRPTEEATSISPQGQCEFSGWE